MPVSITIELPEEAFSIVRGSPSDFGQEMLLTAAVKWYEMGKVSQGKAAALAGLSRQAFIEKLGYYGISPFQETAEELRTELERG